MQIMAHSARTFSTPRNRNRVAAGLAGLCNGGRYHFQTSSVHPEPAWTYTTYEVTITKSATRLDELANPNHQLADSRVGKLFSIRTVNDHL